MGLNCCRSVYRPSVVVIHGWHRAYMYRIQLLLPIRDLVGIAPSSDTNWGSGKVGFGMRTEMLVE
eukprot:1317941-Pyramimonas_sp.AAC.1